jgi:hypothetical protein
VNFIKLQKLEESIQILRKIKETLPDAILAGGAIRDVYHNKNVKDYDLFVSGNTTLDVYKDSFWEKQFSLGNELHVDDSITNLSDLSDSEDASCEGTTHVDTVWEVNKNGSLYNVIILNANPTEYINRFFDIGICKTYSDGRRIRFTSDFMHDSRNHLLTIVSESMSQPDFNRMMDRHVAAVKLKYPGYKLVVPPRFAEYYKEYNLTLKA